MSVQPENIEETIESANPEYLSINSLPEVRAESWVDPVVYRDYTGEKYLGGFGATSIFDLDYATLRARSRQLFTENIYARGLIRRLVTNVINRGLSLEATPDEGILGVPKDSLADWSETVENRFAIWAKSPKLCDYYGKQTFGKIQQSVYREALVSGDVLIVQYLDDVTGLPKVRLISGESVTNPLSIDAADGDNTIEYGVELDSAKKHVAYWVINDDGEEQRIPAYGPNSGRRIAWLYYASEERIGEVRGEPLLGLILQSIKEIDRYRDSAQRKATINSILAMFIKKTVPKMGSLPVSGGVVKKGTITGINADGTSTARTIGQAIPGLVLETLQEGEEPTVHSTHGTDVNFPVFEAAVLSAIAWANEIPPEILRLTYGHNYSATQAAVNELRLKLDPCRESHADQMCAPIYDEFLTSEVISGKTRAPGFLAAKADMRQYDIYGAWVKSDWSGAIKPSTDLAKMTKGYKDLVAEGWCTNQRAARELTGTKFSQNIAIIRRENEAKAEANEPLVQQEDTRAPSDNQAGIDAILDRIDELTEMVETMQGVANDQR